MTLLKCLPEFLFEKPLVFLRVANGDLRPVAFESVRSWDVDRFLWVAVWVAAVEQFVHCLVVLFGAVPLTCFVECFVFA